MEKIPEIFKKAGYKHIPEEELQDMYRNLETEYGKGSKMFNITFDFDKETNEFSDIQREEYGKYLRRKKLENLKKHD